MTNTPNNDSPFNPETMDVILQMDALEFEAVHTVLQQFVRITEAGGFGTEEDEPRPHDIARTIRGLNFTFVKKD